MVRRCAERVCVSYEAMRGQPLRGTNRRLSGGSLKRTRRILFNCAGYDTMNPREDLYIWRKRHV